MPAQVDVAIKQCPLMVGCCPHYATGVRPSLPAFELAGRDVGFASRPLFACALNLLDTHIHQEQYFLFPIHQPTSPVSSAG